MEIGLPGSPLDRGPAVVDGLVYQPTSGGSLVALRVGDGSRTWRQDFDQTGITTPSVIDGTVYVGLGLQAPAGPQVLVAVASSDGGTMWSWSSPAERRVAVAAVDHGTVLVTAKDEGIASVDPATGRQRWMTPIPGIASIGGALVDGTLVSVADDDSVVALDSASGSTLWTAPVAGTPGPPVVVDGRVFVATSFGTVVALGDRPGTLAPSGR